MQMHLYSIACITIVASYLANSRDQHEKHDLVLPQHAYFSLDNWFIILLIFYHPKTSAFLQDEPVNLLPFNVF